MGLPARFGLVSSVYFGKGGRTAAFSSKYSPLSGCDVMAYLRLPVISTRQKISMRDRFRQEMRRGRLEVGILDVVRGGRWPQSCPAIFIRLHNEVPPTFIRKFHCVGAAIDGLWRQASFRVEITAAQQGVGKPSLHEVKDVLALC